VLDSVPFVLAPKVAAAASSSNTPATGPLAGLDRLLADVDVKLANAQRLTRDADGVDFRLERSVADSDITATMRRMREL